MTRQEFIDNIQYWSELLEFCSDEGCNYCEDIYDSDQWNDSINDDVYEMARTSSWRTILDVLQGYDDLSGYDYYRRDDYGEWHGLDEDDFSSDLDAVNCNEYISRQHFPVPSFWLQLQFHIRIDFQKNIFERFSFCLADISLSEHLIDNVVSLDFIEIPQCHFLNAATSKIFSDC